MSKFISKILLFTSILLVLIMSFIVSIYLTVKKNSDFKIGQDNSSVIFGHSHPACAFNDSLISNFKNFSKAGENYFYTYQKVKQIVSQNPQVKNVFIEFTNNNISTFRDEEIWNNNVINSKYPIYAPFMDVEDHLLLISNNFLGYSESLPNAIKAQINRIKSNKYNYSSAIGGYMYLKRNKTDSILKASEKPTSMHNMHNMHKTGISYNHIAYLEKIIAFCKKNGKNIYLIRSPYHKKSIESENEQSLQVLKKEKFNAIDFLDFKDFPLKNSDYGDLTHLNFKGAKTFSIWFDELLKDNILKKNNMQQIIDDRILKYNSK